MARATWTQNNFNGGEWSPITYGRADLDRYKNALSLCENYVPLSQGGLTRRPGTSFVARIKNAGQEAVLVRFEFSITQAYVLEFGPQYIRFFTNGGQLLNGATPYEIPSPYTAADLRSLRFAQSADVLYITQKNYPPAKLVRAGSLNWTLSNISFIDGPYLNTNFSTTTLNPTGSTGTITVTASSTLGVNDGAGFGAPDVGRLLRIRFGGGWGWGTILSVTSSTVVSVRIDSSPGGTHPATSFWRLGLWGARNGYPACVVFHQDRLFLGGGNRYPSRIDGSNVSNYETMSPSDIDGLVVDSHAIALSLESNAVHVINWMESDEWGLLCGTTSAEWVVAPNSTQSALTPTNRVAKQVSAYGTHPTAPARMGKSLLFMQRAGRKLRELSYQFTLGTFQAPDLSLVSEHMTRSKVLQTAVVNNPQPILWVCREDGNLVGLSYDKDQEVHGWHSHVLGGYANAERTAPPFVESIVAIPSEDGSEDELWLSVRRYINGSVCRYVEKMERFWAEGFTSADGKYLDAGAEYVGAPIGSVSGLTWLIGETVSLLVDGSTHPEKVVSAQGVVLLDRSASRIQIGLHADSKASTMKIEAGGTEGPAQGKIKRLHNITFRFFQSIGLTLLNGGPVLPSVVQSFRSASDRMDLPPGLYSGDFVCASPSSYETEGVVSWSQPDPLPSNILLLSVALQTQDGG